MGCPSGQQSFAILPYIRGITEPLTWILKRHSIKVFKKPTNILQQDCPVPKFRPPEDNQLAILFTKSLVHDVNGVTSVKLKDHLAPEEKNILEIQHHVLKAPMLLNMHGPLTTQLTETTQQSLTIKTIAPERQWNHGTQQKLLRMIITHAHSRDNTTFF